MTDPTDPKSNADAKPPIPAVISSHDLLAGRREVAIQHGQELYRLRVTASNKLILIK